MAVLHFRRGIWPMYGKIIRQDLQNWAGEMVATLALPLTFFLTFGLGLRSYVQNVEGVPYLAFVAPGLISLTILLEAYRTGAWNLWLDRWHQKMLDEFRIKPITTSDIIIGEILGGFTMALVKGALVAVCLYLLSPLRFDLAHVPAYLAYLFPGSILFTCAGTMVGTVCRKPDQIAQTQTIVVTPLLYLGGLFFPTSVFPGWLQPIIPWLPTTVLFQTGRQALLYGTVDARNLILLTAYAGVAFWLATTMFNRKLSE